jgi:peptidylprolyl isomerase
MYRIYRSKIKILICMVMLITLVSVAQGEEKGDKSKKEKVVKDGSRVKLHYTLKVEGEIIDSSRDREPFVFQVGSNQVIPGFEKGIKGMKVGEKKSFKVLPKDGYGEVNKEAIQEVPKEKMPKGIELKPGMTLYVSGGGGYPMPVKVVEVKKDVVVIDFNHPLAGKTLNFDVEILEIF